MEGEEEFVQRFLALRDVEVAWPLLPPAQDHTGWGARQALDLRRRRQRFSIVHVLSQRDTHARINRHAFATHVFRRYLLEYVRVRLRADEDLTPLRELLVILMDRRARVRHLQQRDETVFPWLFGGAVVTDDLPFMRTCIDLARQILPTYSRITRVELLTELFRMDLRTFRDFVRRTLPTFRNACVAHVLARIFRIAVPSNHPVSSSSSGSSSPSSLVSSEDSLFAHEVLGPSTSSTSLSSTETPSNERTLEVWEEEEEDTSRVLRTSACGESSVEAVGEGEGSGDENDFVSLGEDSVSDEGV